MKNLYLPFAALLALTFGSCTIKTEHEVKPIEINVNVRVQVEQQLDNFFADLDSQAADLAN